MAVINEAFVSCPSLGHKEFNYNCHSCLVATVGKLCHIVDKDVETLRDFNRRLVEELGKHGWGDFHYGPQEQDPAIVRLREEYEDKFK